MIHDNHNNGVIWITSEGRGVCLWEYEMVWKWDSLKFMCCSELCVKMFLNFCLLGCDAVYNLVDRYHCLGRICHPHTLHGITSQKTAAWREKKITCQIDKTCIAACHCTGLAYHDCCNHFIDASIKFLQLMHYSIDYETCLIHFFDW